MIKLQQLMGMRKPKHEHPPPRQKIKLDVGSLVLPRVANANQDNDTKIKRKRHRSLPSSEFEGQILLQNIKKGNAPPEKYHLQANLEQNISNFKDGEGGWGKKRIPALSVAKCKEMDFRTQDLIVLNEKKKPPSPGNTLKVQPWESTTPDLVKVERSAPEGGETTTVDISQGKGRFNSIECELGDSLKQFIIDCHSGQEPVEDNFQLRAAKESVESSGFHGCKPISIPAKWKKETKEELRRMIHEQVIKWKIDEDAVEELRRRLELLEKYKLDIQGTSGRRRSLGSMDCFLTRLEEKLDDFPTGFNSFYNSPIYEEQSGGAGNSCLEPAQPNDFSPTREPECKYDEIHQLTVDITSSKSGLLRCGSKTSSSPAKENDFQCSPPAHIDPPPLSMVIPDWPTHFLSGFEVSLMDRHCHQSDYGFGGLGRHAAAVLPDDQFEEIKIIMPQAVQNGCKDYTERHIVSQFEGSSQRQEHITDDRSWVPVPDGLNEKAYAQSENFGRIQKGYPNRNGVNNGSIISSSDEGENHILKSAVLKLSTILGEQEGKLRKFNSTATNKAQDDSSESINLRNFYMELLKGLSQQLGELCRDLFLAGTRSCPKPHCTKITDGPHTADPTAEDFRGGSRENIDQKRADDTNLLLSEPLNTKIEQLSNEGVEYRVEDSPVHAVNLRTALSAAEKRIKEELHINLLLTEKLESGAKHLSNVMEEHAQEVAQKDQNISLLEQINIQLANEMAKTEKSSAELRSQYKALVASSEGQLQDVRNEVTSLQDSVHSLNLELTSKGNLVSKLEEEKKEQDLQIHEMRAKLQSCQVEIDSEILEKSELARKLEAMKKEAHVQNYRVTELVNISEDLIAYSYIMENEITELMNTVKALELNLQEKTDEAKMLAAKIEKISQDVVEARKDGEAYQFHCEFLKSKLEETELELTTREDALETLSHHLSKTIEGQDLILEAKDQLILSLSKAQYKEHHMDDQVRQSKIIIQELEEKLSSMDAEINKARLEMANMKAKRQEALAMERQAGEIRNRFFRLDKEIMENDSEISVLKLSFPREYVSVY